MIFGRPGSGKTTVAIQLHKLTSIPLYHLDKYFFLANWSKRPTAEFLSIQEAFVDQAAWIIDGNCTASLEMRYAKADVCLYFNVSRLTCLWRLVRRQFQHRSHIDDRADDCPEKIRWQLIKYMWTFQDRVRDQISYMRNKYPQVQFVEVKNDNQMKSVLKHIIDVTTRLL